MNKRFIPILSFSMTVSLFIFIGLQIYWLKQAIDSNELEFSSKIYKVLENVSEKVNQEELNSYYKDFNSLIKTAQETKHKPQVNIIQSVIDSAHSQYILYKKYIIDQEKVPLPNYKGDSLTTTKIYTDQGVVKIQKDKKDIKRQTFLMEESLKNSTFTLDQFAKLNNTQKPLKQRININKLDSILNLELKLRQIDSKPEIAILNTKLEPVLKTKFYYNIKNSKNYKFVLFKDQKDLPKYYLSVYFPNKNSSLINPIFGAIILTLTTTIIIISIYITSIRFMNRQKKLSEIKTDFINNMSHEFKTPIATISVATDALTNDKIITNPEKVKYYSNLIKNENKRMLKQVEMVLRMSKLEKNMTQLFKVKTNMRNLIKNAVESIKIQVEERGGTITANYTAENYLLEVDEFHIGNSVINLLDNANKYSLNTPKIEIKTYNQDNFYVFKISDSGIGISQDLIDKIFIKFYRIETGDIHNVKGHGLGLAYVKKIITLHQGEIEVHSELNKGSTFIIKLPLKI